MKQTCRLIAILGVSFIGILAAPAKAAVVTFDAFEAPGTSVTVHPNPVDTEGFRFTALGQFGGVPVTWQSGSTWYNGSAALTASNSSDIEMTKLGGGVFDVSAIDVDRLYGSVGSFEFVGNLSGGGQVIQSFTADSSLGNQTVTLVGFQDLTSLILGAVGIQGLANLGSVDNINTMRVNAVPVPAAIWLFATALLGLKLKSRQRKA